MTRPIDLAGFEAKFAADPDPWRTLSDRDEARKRAAILAALGLGRAARLLELASGNGSNSRALAGRALRLDACEGTARGVSLTRAALSGRPRARAHRLVLPGRFPRARYDAVVIAELLYYLSPLDLRRVARDVAGALRPGGRLVLAHHTIDFDDTALHAAGIHARFLARSGARWRRRGQESRNGRWRVAAWVKVAPREGACETPRPGE